MQRDNITNVRWFLCKVPLTFFHILIKLEFSRQIFEKKFSNIKFNENLSDGSRVYACG